MRQDRQRRWGKLGGSVVVSVALHLAIAIALLIHLPDPVPEPQQEEETVSVEIVAAPEEEPQPEAPGEAAPEEQAQENKAQEQPASPPAEETIPEEVQPEQPVTEPEAAEQPPAEPPPAEEEPPAAPPPPEEQAEEPPPEEQAAPEQAAEAAAQQAEQPPPGEAGGNEAPKLEILRPVFAFGEKDAGPREDADGNAAQEAETTDAEGQQEPPEAADKPAVEPAPTPELAETPPGAPLPADLQLPEATMAETAPEAGATPSNEPGDALVALPAEKPVDEPAPEAKPTELAAIEPPAALKRVQKLFSQNATGDASATTAMGDLPRDVRADQLCVTELREQLRHATPAYRPELLPSYRLKQGNVLDVKRAAFRADQQWYNLSFRCEVDDAATKVLSFAFSVGSSIPRGEWRKRGFPDL